ncbi:TPA: ABC transporter permease [Streptococcus suis]|nr:ABC transporter permease [Streptococcus suis]
MGRYFKAEWKKARKIQLLLIGMAFLTFSSFIGLGIYFSNRDVLVEGTQSLVLWGQLTFYNSTLLYPPMLAIIAGLLIIPEFERKNLEMLKANQVSMWKLYFGKLLCSFFIILPVQLVLLIIFIIAIHADGIILDLSLQTYIKWLLLSLLASVPIIILQSYITVKTRNFSKSIGIATVGSVLNFVLIFINEDLTKFFPYSQPMVALRSRALTDMSFGNLSIFLVVNSIFSILFYKLTVDVLEKNN